MSDKHLPHVGREPAPKGPDSFFLNLNFLNLLLFFIYSFVCFLTVLFPLQLIFNVYKSSSTSIQFCISILSFFPFLSTYFLVLFSLLYSPIGTLLQVCSPVCALVSFVLVDIIFYFLCSLGQCIVFYFCWIVLILLMGIYVYMYIQSHFLLLLWAAKTHSRRCLG